MKKSIYIFLAVFFQFSIVPILVHATIVRPSSLKEMTEKSNTIVIGIDDNIQYMSEILPQVVSNFPENQGTSVDLDVVVSVEFNIDIKAETIDADSFFLNHNTNSTITYNTETQTATLTPITNLLPNITYTATVTTQVQDINSNPLANQHIWQFSTGIESIDASNEDKHEDDASLTVSGNGFDASCFIKSIR
jgi:hypothetical protein